MCLLSSCLTLLPECLICSPCGFNQLLVYSIGVRPVCVGTLFPSLNRRPSAVCSNPRTCRVFDWRSSSMYSICVRPLRVTPTYPPTDLGVFCVVPFIYSAPLHYIRRLLIPSTDLSVSHEPIFNLALLHVKSTVFRDWPCLWGSLSHASTDLHVSFWSPSLRGVGLLSRCTLSLSFSAHGYW